MKTLELQRDITGTASYIKIIMKDTKGSGKISSNNTFFDDSCFRSFKMTDEAKTEGVDYCGTMKKSHKGFDLLCWKNQCRSDREVLVLF